MNQSSIIQKLDADSTQAIIDTIRAGDLASLVDVYLQHPKYVEELHLHIPQIPRECLVQFVQAYYDAIHAKPELKVPQSQILINAAHINEHSLLKEYRDLKMVTLKFWFYLCTLDQVEEMYGWWDTYANFTECPYELKPRPYMRHFRLTGMTKNNGQ